VRRVLLPALAIAVLGALPVAAQTLRSLKVPVELAVGLDGESGDLMQGVGEVVPRLELDLAHDSSLVLSARLRLDAEEELEPGTPGLDSYAPASKPFTVGSAGTLELRDVYWERRFASGLARLGKQQIVWGRLDGIKVLDVLNPQSYRAFILDDFGDSRISLWSGYLDVFAGAWRVEAAVIPDYTAHEIPEQGAWFELTAPRFRFGAPPGAPAPSEATDRGRGAAEDGALGLRLSRSLGRLDVSFLGYTGSDHEPLGRLRGGGREPVLERFHERRELFGVSAETALGSIALRAEAALQPSRVFNTRGVDGLQTARADQVSAGIAADINGPFDVLLNVQFLWDEVIDPPPGLIRPGRDRVATLFLRRGFAYDTARVEARWYHALDDGDDLYRLRLDYDLGDNSTVYLGGDWFAGRRTGLFGQFAERDRVVFGVRHTF